ncbi:MAG: VCBS repeat-containing protein [Verrucomicrobiaceae bacterium]|nr:VCBS repeat-containing protein [Verrucomicrobiaceae bacterium]
MERPDRINSRMLQGVQKKAQGEEVKDVRGEWQSERLSIAVLADLKNIFDTDAGSPRGFPGLFRATVALPDDLRMVSESSSGVTEWRSIGSSQWIGGKRFSESVKLLLQRFPSRSDIKLTSISVATDRVEVVLIVEHAGEGMQANVQWRGVWGIKSGDQLELLELKMEDYVETRSKSPVFFTEVTEQVIGGTPHFDSQVKGGISHWAGNVTRFGDMALTGHHGIAVGDIDGDGREDLFVCDGGSLPNRLYRQLPDGSAEDVSRYCGLDWLEDSRAGLLIDIDNDGDQDLVVATIAMVVFAENDGAGRFAIKGGFPRAQYPFSLCAADYDLDGDLDIYVCVYGEGDANSNGRGFAARAPVPFEDARNGGRNVLLENLGGFAFADVTDEVGMGKNNDRWSFAASWEDYDLDGDVDLYVANDFGRNCLYRNEGGKFDEVGESLGVEDIAAGMSVSWGDFNRDGYFDLYVGNMFSAAGRRVSKQGHFASGRSRDSIAGLQRMARGNSLFSGGSGNFKEVPDAAGSAIARWAWSSGFVDIDNDGWEDLVVANGYLTGWTLKDDL